MPERDLEAWTRTLRTDGYRPSVAARRLIEERGLAEEAAIQLVQRVYETPAVDPREGTATLRLLFSTGTILAGLAMVAWPAMWPEGFNQALLLDSKGHFNRSAPQTTFVYWAMALFILGWGLKMLIFATANRNDPSAPGTDEWKGRRKRKPFQD
jgi:hypothetical protein